MASMQLHRWLEGGRRVLSLLGTSTHQLRILRYLGARLTQVAGGGSR